MTDAELERALAEVRRLQAVLQWLAETPDTDPEVNREVARLGRLHPSERAAALDPPADR